MLILDTNHYSEIEMGTRRGERLLERLAATGEACFVCVITTEESLRGWHQLRVFRCGENTFRASPAMTATAGWRIARSSVMR